MLDREPVKAPSLASSRPERLERQKFYAPIQIVRLPNGCNQFQIIDESADRYAQLGARKSRRRTESLLVADVRLRPTGVRLGLLGHGSVGVLDPADRNRPVAPHGPVGQ